MFFIHVLRIKCELLPQGDFLRSAREPIDIITRSFEAKPTADVGRGSEWHIGNVEPVVPDGLAFAMGRTVAVKSPQFDSVSHNFLEEEAMRAPFTVGYLTSDIKPVALSASQVSRRVRRKSPRNWRGS